MHEFQLHQPDTLMEVHELLNYYGEDAQIVAGGTGLVLGMKLRLVQPQHLIALRRVSDLKGIQGSGSQIRIGAMTPHRAIETSPIVQEQIPLLSETYRRVATVRIRNMATVGGGLAHADPNQDPQPALIALGAWVRLASLGGSRTILVEDLSTDYYETVISHGEVLTEVEIPRPPIGAGTAFIKFTPRTADDYATVSVAVLLNIDSFGNCQEVRIGLGSCGRTALRARNAENALRGRALVPKILRDIGGLASREVDPLGDIRGSSDYKREMVEVFTRRALEQARDMIKQ